MKILFTFLIILLCSVSILTQVSDKKPTGKTILYADGVRDDTDALNAWGENKTVYYKDGKKVGDVLQNKQFLISWCLRLNRPNSTVRFNTFIVKHPTPFRRSLIDFRFNTRHYGNTLYNDDWFMWSNRRRGIRLD